MSLAQAAPAPSVSAGRTRVLIADDSVVVRGCLLDGAAREQMLDDVLAASQDPAAAAAPGPMVCACCR